MCKDDRMVLTLNSLVDNDEQIHYHLFFFVCFFLFNSVLRPFQDYFSSYETVSRWAKTGEPREKPPGTPTSRTWLVSHVARHSGEMIE